MHSKDLQKAIDEVQKYYKTETNKIAILQNYLSDNYIKKVIERYETCGFTELELVERLAISQYK